MKRDYYEVLGVERTAVRTEIQTAYRQLARQWHPDVNPGDPDAEERFKEINEAYSVLSDEDRRGHYDRYGPEGVDGNFSADPFQGVQDIFDIFFGGQSARQRSSGARHGGDVHVHVHISLLEALKGVRTEFTFERFEVCEKCESTGAKAGTKPQKCNLCGGTGQMRQRRDGFFGTTVVTTTCPQCGGDGQVITEKCQACVGNGRVARHVDKQVDIPAGMEDGSTLQVPREGHDGLKGGRSGDLYVTVGVEADPRFQRRGTELYTAVGVSFAQLALGDTLTVEGLDETVEVDLKPGTQHDAELIVRGKGMPALGRNDRGNLHVMVHLEVPRKLTDRQAELLREFEAETGPEPRRKKKTYLDRFKETLLGDE